MRVKKNKWRLIIILNNNSNEKLIDIKRRKWNK